jgi:hypothetical protein
MSNEAKDRRLKYVELPRIFKQRANEIDITSKQHLRTCEKLASQLSQRKPKTADEFEKVEAMKDFIIRSSELNEKTIDLIKYMQDVITEISEEAGKLASDSLIFDQLNLQSDTIQVLIQQREKLISEVYAGKKADLRAN